MGMLGRLAGKVTGRVVETVQPDVVLSHVDLDAQLARIDINRLLDRIDIERLLDRVDVDRLLDRVDVERLLERVDVERLVERVDVEGLVRRAGVAGVVVESQARLAGSVLDLVRRQLAGLDALLDRGVRRLLRRDVPIPTGNGRLTITGHHAGAVSRAAATALDLLIITTSFTIALAGVNLLTNAFWGLSVRRPLPATAGVAALAVCYALGFLAIAARTPGQGIVGLRIVRSDGGTIHPGQALRWVLAFPLSVVPLGLGFLPIVFQREHRALHDLLAGTAVVHDWGDRPAELPGPLSAFLARQAESP
ncbi:RDD family protein [Kribbella sindirgiensis]|uniref:RDD family protein n=1 Tax=Kribbella sindirgiensis TaxID=1124744 RepID=A0A4R0INB9_9ACTN|nr:RDD family protein [Kribbella sindirgiensis]